MSNVSIYEKNWIDLVFDGKNQQYGAYQLRKESSKISLLSLFFGTLLVGGIIAVFTWSSIVSNTTESIIPIIEENEIIRVTKFVFPEKEKVALKKLPEKKTSITVTEPTNLSNMVVANTTVSVDVPINDAQNVAQTSTSVGTVEGSIDGTAHTTSNTPENPVNETGLEVFKSNELDKSPSFPNGMERFYQYIGTNFEKPVLDTGNTLSILVAFVIEKDGSITDIKVLRNPGYGLGDEAIRVLKSLKTKWNPGIKRGKPVRTEYVLPIKVKMN